MRPIVIGQMTGVEIGPTMDIYRLLTKYEIMDLIITSKGYEVNRIIVKMLKCRDRGRERNGLSKVDF